MEDFPIGSAIDAGTGLIGDGINAFVSWKGMQKQMKENRRVEGVNMKIREEDIARDDARYEDVKRDKALSRKDRLKMEKYQKSIGLVNGLSSIMNRQPMLAQNLIAMYKARN